MDVSVKHEEDGPADLIDQPPPSCPHDWQVRRGRGLPD